ncbi:MAG TPA: hypothetical protein VGF31_03855 [Myxococcaceae bacterium]
MTVRFGLAVLAAIALGCGRTNPEGSTSWKVLPPGSPAPSSSPSVSECSKLAATYLAAFRAATACIPGPVSRCTVQRPLVHGLAGSSGPDGLCWVAYLGMLEPERATALDPLIDAYTSAGCEIGFCPGPSPHATECLENEQGTDSCGGG